MKWRPEGMMLFARCSGGARRHVVALVLTLGNRVQELCPDRPQANSEVYGSSVSSSVVRIV